MSKMTDEEILEVLGSSLGYEDITSPVYGLTREDVISFAHALLDEDVEIITDHKRLVKELDVVLNGDAAAEQASLCDIVSQLKKQRANIASVISKDDLHRLVDVVTNYCYEDETVFGDKEHDYLLKKAGFESKQHAVFGEWIPVSERLPDLNKFVLVYEDDNDNPQDAFIGKLCNSFRQTVSPAKLLYIDEEGYAEWYLCMVGGGPAGRYRNVTHWIPLPAIPINVKNKNIFDE